MCSALAERDVHFVRDVCFASDVCLLHMSGTHHITLRQSRNTSLFAKQTESLAPTEQTLRLNSSLLLNKETAFAFGRQKRFFAYMCGEFGITQCINDKCLNFKRQCFLSALHSLPTDERIYIVNQKSRKAYNDRNILDVFYARKCP